MKDSPNDPRPDPDGPADRPIAGPEEPQPNNELADFIAESTLDGLFPAVAFGLDPTGAPETAAILTSSIADFPTALDLVERVNREPVLPSRFIPLNKLQYIAEKNAIMKYHSRQILGFDSRRIEDRKALSGLFAYCTASKWASRAFVLVDMVEFSLRASPQQLALRMSLGQAITTAANRLRSFEAKNLVSIRGFNRVSTGDGFYIWNYDPTPEGHVVLFLYMVLLLSHVEAMRKSGMPNLRLRTAFGIGEAYTFPYNGPGIPARGRLGSGFMPDAIGPIVNNLNRILKDASPGQMLTTPFDESGRDNRPFERLTVDTMLRRVCSELLPAELQPGDPVKAHDIRLQVSPSQPLRVTDKHGSVHHCFNVCGSVPYRDRTQAVRLQTIGLSPDEAPALLDTPFRD